MNFSFVFQPSFSSQIVRESSLRCGQCTAAIFATRMSSEHSALSVWWIVMAVLVGWPLSFCGYFAAVFFRFSMPTKPKNDANFLGSRRTCKQQTLYYQTIKKKWRQLSPIFFFFGGRRNSWSGNESIKFSWLRNVSIALRTCVMAAFSSFSAFSWRVLSTT